MHEAKACLIFLATVNSERMGDRATGRQGDRATGRQGDTNPWLGGRASSRAENRSASRALPKTRSGLCWASKPADRGDPTSPKLEERKPGREGYVGSGGCRTIPP